MVDLINKLFQDLKKQKIKYSSSGEDIPKKIPRFILASGVNELGYIEPQNYPEDSLRKIELKIEKKQVNELVKILKSLGFKFYRYSDSLTYFYFDMDVGLIQLNLVFQENQKIKFKKTPGKFICFVAPEGGGKTTTLSAIYTILENFPVERKLLNFSSFKESKIWRIYDLMGKILKVKFNNNKVILSDRYIYLTFRENKFLKKIFRFFAPEPDIVFVLKSDYKTLKKRREILCKSEEKVRETYNLFGEAKNKIIIDTGQPINKNRKVIIDKILDLYSSNEDEKLIRKIVSRT